MSFSSENRLNFTTICYRLMDLMNEFEAWLFEYNEGMPIVRDAKQIIERNRRLKNKVEQLMIDYASTEDSMSLE